MYKILNNHSAPDLKDKFNRRETNLNDYNLRNASVNLPVPKPNSEYLRKKTFWVQWSRAMEQPVCAGKADRICKQLQKFNINVSSESAIEHSIDLIIFLKTYLYRLQGV